MKVFHFRGWDNSLLGTIAFEHEGTVTRIGSTIVNPNDVNRKEVIGSRTHTYKNGSGEEKTVEVPIIRRQSISKKEGKERAVHDFVHNPILLNSAMVKRFDSHTLLVVLLSVQGSLVNANRMKKLLNNHNPISNHFSPWSK